MRQEVEYRLIRSRRTTYSISLSGDATLTLRVPLSVGDREAEQLLLSRQSWITRKLSEQAMRRKNAPPPRYTKEELSALEQPCRQAAKKYIAERAAYFTSRYGDILESSYERICIRDQKTRWGSCSGRKTLSFNWRLMLAPPAVLDYVVVHELCHLKHMNHSAQFWSCVEQILPDYRKWRKWLKDHGHELTPS